MSEPVSPNTLLHLSTCPPDPVEKRQDSKSRLYKNKVLLGTRYAVCNENTLFLSISKLNLVCTLKQQQHNNKQMVD